MRAGSFLPRLRAAPAALAAVVLVPALVACAPASPAEGGRPTEEPAGPVLLVPGYGGGTAVLQPLADRLTAAGRDATVVSLPDGGTGDLTASATALATAATSALERTGAESVDVVGYSAGGVVARLWVAAGAADVVRRVVTLGAPHHGTTLADLAGAVAPRQCPVGCRQLATGSPVLAELNAGDETPDGVSWVSIWTTQDGTVTPAESARLDGALNLPVQSVCADAQIGHGALPTDPVVQEIVLIQLAAGDDPRELGPGDCAGLGG